MEWPCVCVAPRARWVRGWHEIYFLRESAIDCVIEPPLPKGLLLACRAARMASRAAATEAALDAFAACAPCDDDENDQRDEAFDRPCGTCKCTARELDLQPHEISVNRIGLRRALIVSMITHESRCERTCRICGQCSPDAHAAAEHRRMHKRDDRVSQSMAFGRRPTYCGQHRRRLAPGKPCDLC